MAASLRQLLAPHLIAQEPPGLEAFHSVPEAPLVALAQAQGRGLAELMLECLQEGLWPERLRPNRGTLSASEQARLWLSSVVVLGAGGLGGMVVLQLARLGVGRLTVCDGDVFEESNLNRQFLATRQSLGRNKALAAAQAVAAINPAVRVRACPVWAAQDNLPDLLADCQVALDCLDNLPARYLLEEAAAKAGLPYVHGALAGLEGMVMTVRPGDPGLAGLYGPQPIAKADSAESFMGVPTPTPAFIATLQVAEVMKLLLDWPGLGRGQVLHADLGVPSLEVLQLG